MISHASSLALRSIEPARLALEVWLAGVLVFTLRYLAARLRLRRIVAAAAPAPPTFCKHHEAIGHELRLARLPRLRVTGELDSPALLGVIRPIVLLPRWLVERGWSASARYALRHELAHQKWRDPLAIAVRDLATTLFHFHPAAWWAARRHLEAVELACDRASLRDAAEAPDYAERLIEIARGMREHRSGDRPQWDRCDGHGRPHVRGASPRSSTAARRVR
jgi:beta-lactamase regulating signal transducer with metallopeptidase domain